MSCKFPIDAKTDDQEPSSLKKLRDYLTVQEVRKSVSLTKSRYWQSYVLGIAPRRLFFSSYFNFWRLSVFLGSWPPFLSFQSVSNTTANSDSVSSVKAQHDSI